MSSTNANWWTCCLVYGSRPHLPPYRYEQHSSALKVVQEKWPKEMVSALKLEIDWGKIGKLWAERGRKGTLTFVAKVYKDSSAVYFCKYVEGMPADL